MGVFFVIVVTATGWAAEPQGLQPSGWDWAACETAQAVVAHDWEDGSPILVSPCVRMPSGSRQQGPMTRADPSLHRRKPVQVTEGAVGHGSWRNRIVGHGEADPTRLLPYPKNWYLHPDAQRQVLKVEG